MPSSPPPGLLTAANISKRFGITQALDDVSVSFFAGEVHALMGENGAGKSTLGKVIAGLHRADAGTVTIQTPDGPHNLKPGSVQDAFDAGVRIVHQELAQCPNLTVAENLCLHDIPTRYGLVNYRAMEERARRLLAGLEPGINPRARLGSLSPGHRQIVQIAGALDDRASIASGGAHRQARVIVLDEPTSSLSIAEVERLLQIVRQLARSGITIIYVSHRMGEIFQVCDRVTVLRDGKHVATSSVKEIDEPTLVEQMIGRRLEATAKRHQAATGTTAATARAEKDGEAAILRALSRDHPHAPIVGQPLLVVRNLSSPGKIRDITLSVAAGEIVGVGGLVGSGRSELLDAIFGLDPRATGLVSVLAFALPKGQPRAAINAGVGYVPEDRKLQGLFFQLGVGENIVVPIMARLARAGLRSLRAERSHVGERIKSFQVKAASTSSLPGELSGGNQQKLLIARWMGKGTRVLLLDEPTRGIDVGTKAEIYRLIREAADSGAAVLLVSSEMPELLALSDRILVLCEGRLTGELKGDQMTQASILRLATTEARPAPAARPA